MNYNAVTKASATLETEMTQNKGLRNLAKEILAKSRPATLPPLTK